MSATTTRRVGQAWALGPAAPGFGALLRGHRIGAGWSQKTMAARANIERTCISRLESGSRRAGPPTVAALADALGLGAWARAEFYAWAGYLPCEPTAALVDALAAALDEEAA